MTSMISRGSAHAVNVAGEDNRQVVVRGALGDVRRGQPRDHPGPGLELDEILDRGDPGEEVLVGELDALGRPGRPRRVDEREHVAGLDLGRGGIPVEVGVRALDILQREAPSTTGFAGGARAVALDEDHVLERVEVLPGGEEVVGEAGLGHRDPRSRVLDHVLDLLGGVGGVDGEGSGPEGDRREVDEVELGPVGEQDRDGVAAPEAELGQTPGDGVDALAGPGPGELHRAVLGAEGDLVAVPCDGPVEASVIVAASTAARLASVAVLLMRGKLPANGP